MKSKESAWSRNVILTSKDMGFWEASFLEKLNFVKMAKKFDDWAVIKGILVKAPSQNYLK